MTSTEPFVLNRGENPHPKMLASALEARRRAQEEPHGGHGAFWAGYLEAMADATGCTTAELEAWMDSHA